MVTLLQLINHIGNSFDVLRMEISAVENKPRSEQPKKFEDKELKALHTRRRSESNARGACRIIGNNSTSRFCTIESHGNDSKTGNWVLHELKPRDVERRFFTCEQLIQRQQRKSFLHRIVTAEVDILRQSQEEEILC